MAAEIAMRRYATLNIILNIIRGRRPNGPTTEIVVNCEAWPASALKVLGTLAGIPLRGRLCFPILGRELPSGLTLKIRNACRTYVLVVGRQQKKPVFMLDVCADSWRTTEKSVNKRMSMLHWKL